MCVVPNKRKFLPGREREREGTIAVDETKKFVPLPAVRLLKHDFLLRQAIRDAAYCLSDSNQTLSDQKLTKGITNSRKKRR